MANCYLTETEQAFATGDISAADRLEKGAAYSTTTLALENNVVMNLVFFKDELGGDLNDVVAKITYTHHATPEKVEVLTIQGSEFTGFSSKNGRERCVVEVACLDIPDGNQVVTCEIYNSADTLVGYVEETFAGYAARTAAVAPNLTIYPAILKFSTSAYDYLNQ